MQNSWKMELYQAAALTFEELCFQFPDEELSEQQHDAPVDAAVQVEFWGPFTGTLILRICGGLLPSIAANMLGEIDPPSEAEQCDALGEIANIICGNVLPQIAGVQEVFQLSAPKVIESDHTCNTDPASLMTEIQFSLEKGRAELLLCIDSTNISIGKE
jgi:CheY-specific phosphatase CheX